MQLRQARILSLAVVLAIMPPGAFADAVSASLIFTTFQDQGGSSNGPNVWTVNFNWDGATVTLSVPTPLATTEGADGIVINPLNGNYLVGGQQNGLVNQITAAGAFVSSVASNNLTESGTIAGAYHLKVDPSGNVLWVMAYSPSYTGPPTGDTGGGIAAVPLSPNLTAGTNQLVSGDNNRVTDIGFDPNNQTVYYTASPYTGTGDFGTIDLSTGVTARLFQDKPWAHGIVFDPFTGDFIMVGDNQIAQYDPVSNSVVGLITFADATLFLDQGIVDGNGHLWVAANNGNLVFVDYESTKNVGSGTGSINFLESSLDELTFSSVPEPASASQLAGALACIGWGIWRYRRRSRDA